MVLINVDVENLGEYVMLTAGDYVTLMDMVEEVQELQGLVFDLLDRLKVDCLRSSLDRSL